MKYVFITLLAATAGLWGYNLGQMHTYLQDDRIIISADYREHQCDEVIQRLDDLYVCEIAMKTPYDNLKIYKGAYGNE